MASEAEAVTLYEAFKFLAPLVGGGGLTAIAVAYFGSRRPKAPDQPEVRQGSVGHPGAAGRSSGDAELHDGNQAARRRDGRAGASGE